MKVFLRRQSPQGEGNRDRAGFTLVEVLLSLGLLMLVLAAAYSALTLFQRVTLLGRKDAEQSQLARAIERRISADIRSVLFREAKPLEVEESAPATGGLATMTSGVGAADDAGGTTTASTTDSSSTQTLTPPDTSDPLTAYMTQSVGIFGDSTTLVLHVSKPTAELTATSLQTTSLLASLGSSNMVAPPTASDLRSVSYFLAVAGAGGLPGAVGNTAAGGTAAYSLTSGTQGLVRLDGDRFTIQQLDMTGGVEQLAQSAQVLAAEVTELQFRYYDGTAWQPSWDSAAMNALPKAIEVTLRIDMDTDQQSPDPIFGSDDTPAASDLYRFVVTSPLADPLLGMEL